MATKKVKIKITGSVSAAPYYLSYHVGEVVSVEEKQAAELISAGVAEYANAQKNAGKNAGCENEAKQIETLQKENAELAKDKEALIKEVEALQKEIETLKKASETAKAGKPKS